MINPAELNNFVIFFLFSQEIYNLTAKIVFKDIYIDLIMKLDEFKRRKPFL